MKVLREYMWHGEERQAVAEGPFTSLLKGACFSTGTFR